MTSSSLLTVMVDAAIRSLLMGAAVGAGMFLLRVRNVVAQKSAWALVLAAAILMPWAPRWVAHLPANVAAAITPSRWAQTRAVLPAPAMTQAISSRVVVPARKSVARRSLDPIAVPAAAQETAGENHFPAPAVSSGMSASHTTQPSQPSQRLSAGLIALLLYLAGCAALLARLLFGLSAALQLWAGAEPVQLPADLQADGLRIRSSHRIASPVTIGSGVILPAGFVSWDAEKLRIVLAHEASHVRQGDFYLQLCASLYTALFWFSPLGWWLNRKLGDLSETISDRAAVEHAASHASYAQVLLEFAATPRPVPLGVAMARHGRLIPRIERLLNESSFRQAFAGGRARIAAAVLLVPAALLAATAMVRVEAAQQTPPPPATAPQPAAPLPAAAPDTDARTGVAAPPASDAMTTSSQAPPAAPSLAGPTADIAPVAPEDDKTLTIRNGSDVIILPNSKAWAQMDSKMKAMMQQNSKMFADKAQMMALMQKAHALSADGAWFKYGFGNDGNSYAYVTGTGKDSVHFSGNWYEASKEEIEKARKIAHGDFLWFERDGKSYIIDDPAALAQLKPMQDKMEDLGRQQEELGKQQEALGEKQEELGRQQEQASVPTPDVSKELAQINEAIKKLDAQKGGSVNSDQLADIESKLGDLQGKIGEIQGRIGEKQGELGAKQGELDEQQGKLGEQQGRLGAEQGRIAREMDGKVLTIIDEYMKDGKARQVQ